MKAEDQGNTDAIHLENNRPPSEFVEDQKHEPVNELVERYGQTKRLLKPRHVHLMAIGSSIGVGLWVCGLLPTMRS